MQFPNIFVYSIVNFHILTALSHNGTRTGEETLCSWISKCNESLLFFKCYFIYFPFKKTYLLMKSQARAEEIDSIQAMILKKSSGIYEECLSPMWVEQFPNFPVHFSHGERFNWSLQAGIMKNFYPSHTTAVNLEAQSAMSWLRVPSVLNFCAPFVNSMFVFFERTKTVFLLLSPHLFFTFIVMFHLSIYPLPS